MLYSLNEEEFSHKDIEDAIDEYIRTKTETITYPHILTMYKGDIVKKSGSDYLGNIVNDLTDNSYDELGEHTSEWNELLYKNKDKIQKLMCQSLDTYLKYMNLNPKFHGIEHIEEIVVIVINDKNDYEVCEHYDEFEILEGS